MASSQYVMRALGRLNEEQRKIVLTLKKHPNWYLTRYNSDSTYPEWSFDARNRPISRTEKKSLLAHGVVGYKDVSPLINMRILVIVPKRERVIYNDFEYVLSERGDRLAVAIAVEEELMR